MKDFGTRGKLVIVLFALTTMLGCGALDAGTPVAQSNNNNGLVASTPVIDFGSVAVGTTQVRSNTIVNNSKTPIVLTRAQIDRTDFAISGQKLPLTLAPGQRVMLQVTYSPQNGGDSQGKVLLTSNVFRMSGGFSLRGTAVALASGRITVTPSSLSFGNVQMGKTQTLPATIANPGKSPVTVNRASISGSGFTLSGLTLPLTLQSGQSAKFSVTFNPVAGGNATGTISMAGTVTLTSPKRPGKFGGLAGVTTVALNTMTTTVNVPVAGTGMGTGQLAISPASLALGAVKIGATQTQSATLINSGTSDLTVRQATVTGKGFKMSGISFPLTLAAGQRKTFAVTFAPQSAGKANGSIAVTTDAPTPVVSVPVTAVATSPGALISNPSSLNFSNVQIGKTQTLSAAIANSGGSTVTVSQAAASGPGFTLGGLSLPVTLGPGQSAAFSVTFNAQSGGSASGAVSFASDAPNGALSVPLTASVATSGVLSTSDSSLNFGNVQVGGSSSQSETLTNSGSSNVTISQAKVSGTGFSISGLSLPLTLAPGQSFTFGAAFAPTSGGTANGSIQVVSDASDSNVTITMAGTAGVSGQLAVSPASLNFGSVTVGQSKSLTASLSAGGSSITVSDASMSTSEFTISGISLPLTLAAGKSATFTVTFKPQSSGAASASGSFNSNASNPSLTQALGGTGTAVPQHSVALSWDPSASSVVGYNVYRGTTSGGPYSKVASMNASTDYVDGTVQSGQTYFYVTTAVDGSGKESANSNQTQAVIPTP